MSLLSKFVFDPIKAAFARASTSSNPAVAAAAVSASGTYNQIATTITTASNSGLSINSAPGVGNDIIGELENGLFTAVDAFISVALPTTGPVGAALTPEAIKAANVTLAFAEQHAMTFVSSLFGHAKTQIAATPAPVVTAPLHP